MARNFSKLRHFELCSVRRLSTGLAGVAFALSLSSCGLPPQTNAVPVDVQPLTQCPAVGTGGRALQADEGQIERIVATTILEDSRIC